MLGCRPAIPSAEFVDDHFVKFSGNKPLSEELITHWLNAPEAHVPRTIVPKLQPNSELPTFESTAAKIELGRQLFYDIRITREKSFACIACHSPHYDYAIPFLPPGIERDIPPVFNRIGTTRQFWDGKAESLVTQPRFPIENPHEMDTPIDVCLQRLRDIPGYRLQFERIFGKIDEQALGEALAAFESALITGPGAWDDAETVRNAATESPERLAAEARLKSRPFTEQARRGAAHFFSERFACADCHSGWNFTDEDYHNLGIGQLAADAGRERVTKDPRDRGKFKTPTLRNVARTSPYFHDGSAADLKDAIDVILRGGHRNEVTDIKPIVASAEERAELKAFLESLTGELPQFRETQLPQ